MPSHIILNLWFKRWRLIAGEFHLRRSLTTAFFKVKNISLISMRNYPSVSSRGMRLSSQCSSTAETDRGQSQAQKRKWSVIVTSGISDGIWMIGSAKSRESSLQQEEKSTGLNQTPPRLWGIRIHFSIVDLYPDFLQAELACATVSTCKSVWNINPYIWI